MLLLLLPAGCAKSPAGGGSSPVSGPQLIISMTVNGTLNPNYYYYVVLNVNNAQGPGPGTGPVPSYFPPYGNGFAGGSFTNYVEYHGSQAGGTNFGYYGVTANLLTPVPLGSSRLISPQVNGQTLSFQLPLAYLDSENFTADKINDIEINFIATNVIPAPTDTLVPTKAFDALYQSNTLGNNSKFLTLLVRDPGGAVQSKIEQNSTLNIEPTGDVAQSDGSGNSVPATSTSDITTSLDISDFSIQLVAQ